MGDILFFFSHFVGNFVDKNSHELRKFFFQKNEFFFKRLTLYVLIVSLGNLFFVVLQYFDNFHWDYTVHLQNHY